MKSNTFKYILRVIVGIVFIISSIAKLLSIDSFELYIFGFELFSLGFSYLAARLVIAMELALGIFLIINIDSKFIYWVAMTVLSGFTLFLALLAFAGNEENCNCFGEFVNLNPVQSIIKNIILIAILLLSSKLSSFNLKWKNIWRIIIPIGAIATIFIVSPPDNWRYENYNRGVTLNEEAFREGFETSVLPQEINEGEKVVCFYSLKCEFCRKSAQKIGTMRRMGTFSNAEIIAIIGKGEDSPDPERYFEETKLDCSKYYYISPSDFLRITNGSMPLILVMKDGEVIEKFRYRDIH